MAIFPRGSRPSFGIVFTCLVAVAFLSCESTESPRPSIDRGLQYLAENLPQYADEEFGAVIAENPSATEARLGLGLSRVQGIFHLVDWVLSIAGQNGTYPKSAPPLLLSPERPAPVQDENVFVHDLLDKVLSDILKLTQEANEGFAAASGSPTFKLVIPAAPLTIRERTVMDLGGTWTSNDARLLSSLGHFVEATLYLLLSQDTQSDYFGIFAHAKPLLLSGGLDPGDLTGGTGTATLMNVLAFALTHPQYPNFFRPSTLDLDGNGKADGQEFPQRARSLYASAYSDLSAALDAVRQSPGAESACRFRSSSGKSGKIECGNAEKPLSIPISSSFAASVASLTGHLQKHDPAVLSLKNDFVSPLAVLVSAILQSGLIDIPTLSALGSNPDLIEAAIRGFVAIDIGLDFYTFFDTPFALRDVFPAVRTDLEAREMNFLFEWECAGVNQLAAPLGSTSAYPKGGLTCPEDAALVDSAHFTDTLFASLGISSINKDDTASRFPYIPFKDSTFNGLLYLEKDGQLQKSTLQSLNDLITTLGGLLSSAL
ncbi:MAG: hypothetical protein HYT87_13730 [Nitrospirae bacterium]|nr:hypothetical protein [Nitrospirota bacterium]